MRGEFEVTRRQANLLREAYRRWKKFGGVNDNKTLLQAWTGLGSASHYKPVLDAGLMEPVHGLEPGQSLWWKLTEKGVLAMIMLGWIEGDLNEEETWQGVGGHVFGQARGP